MRRIAWAIGLSLCFATASLAQTPNTTKPNVSNTLAQCAANAPVVGNGAGAAPICHPTGALGSAAFVNTGTSGGTLGLLNAANTYSATQAFAAITATTFNGNAFTAGTGTLTLGAGKTATISNTLTFTGTDGSTVAVGTGGTIGPAGYAALGQIPGTATNDNASAGKIGEYISSTVATGSAVSLTTGTPANVTSISLTAGDWDVSSEVYFNSPATTSFTTVLGSISTTTATLNQTAGFWDVKGFSAFVPGNNTGWISCGVPFVRISVASTTTVFLVAFATFTVSTAAAWGTIQARRAR